MIQWRAQHEKSPELQKPANLQWMAIEFVPSALASGRCWSWVEKSCSTRSPVRDPSQRLAKYPAVHLWYWKL